MLATGGYDSVIRFYDACNQSLIRTLHFPDQHVFRLAFSGQDPLQEDEKLYIIAGGSPTVCIFDVTTNDSSPTSSSPFLPYTGHAEAVTAVGFEPRHTAFVYSASEDGTLQTWLPELAPSPQHMPGATQPYPVAAHDHRYLSAPPKSGIGAHQLRGRPFTPTKFLNHGPHGLVAIHDAIYFPPEDLFFTADALGRLRVWDRQSSAMRKEQIPHRSRRNLQCLALSYDYKTLVVANFDGFIFVYDTNRLLNNPNNDVPVTVRAHSSYITRMTLSTSANLLVCTTRSSSTKIFRMAHIIGTTDHHADNVVVPTLEFSGHPGWIWDAAFVGDGEEYLFTCSSNSQVMLWALNNMRESMEYSGSNKAIVCLAVKERGFGNRSANRFQQTANGSHITPHPRLPQFVPNANSSPPENGLTGQNNVTGGTGNSGAP